MPKRNIFNYFFFLVCSSHVPRELYRDGHKERKEEDEKRSEVETWDIADIDDRHTSVYNSISIRFSYWRRIGWRCCWSNALALDNLILVMRPCSDLICFHFISFRLVWSFCRGDLFIYFIYDTIHAIQIFLSIIIIQLFFFFTCIYLFFWPPPVEPEIIIIIIISVLVWVSATARALMIISRVLWLNLLVVRISRDTCNQDQSGMCGALVRMNVYLLNSVLNTPTEVKCVYFKLRRERKVIKFILCRQSDMVSRECWLK